MKSRNIILIVVFSALFIGVIWVFVISDRSDGIYNWQRGLSLEKDEPYDLSVFHKIVKNAWGDTYNEIPEKASIEKYSLDLSSPGSGIYFYIGKNYYLSTSEIKFLKGYIENGATVFISANNIPEELFQSFDALKRFSMKSYYSDSAISKFRNKQVSPNRFSFINKVKSHTASVRWSYFDVLPEFDNAEEVSDVVNKERSMVQISTIHLTPDASDFLCIYYGEGRLYLHSNPVFFSNYYLTTEPGRKYTMKVLGHLPNEPMWFDLSGGIRKPDSKTGDNARPMYDFISSDASLKYAWWILIGGVVVFLIYGGRRKQRAIPVLAVPQNNTLALVEAIGHFYLKEKSYVSVFKREWNQFLGFIRFNLRFPLNELDKNSALLLSERSGVSMETIEAVFAMYAKYSIFSEITADELLDVTNTINKFYQEYKNKYGK